MKELGSTRPKELGSTRPKELGSTDSWLDSHLPLLSRPLLALALALALAVAVVAVALAQQALLTQ
jgi:hypothetical protein